MESHRHAYCIIAHNDYNCLKKLISLIDDVRNDIILVIDKKSELINLPIPNTRYSKTFTPPYSQLIDIQWGGISLVKAELLAFETALKSGNYKYFHLLSGVDLPLKSQDYIHDYFEKIVDGRNCISFDNDKNLDYVKQNQCGYLHLFTDRQRDHNILKRKFFSLIRITFLMMQKLMHYHRSWNGFTIAKGTEWVSINHDFVKFLVDNKKLILRKFNNVHCPDEIYKHTMFQSFGFACTVFISNDDNDEISNNLRRIDWGRGRPYVWQKSDYEELTSCKEIFARKFSSDVDKEIIDLIYNHVICSQINNDTSSKD